MNRSVSGSRVHDVRRLFSFQELSRLFFFFFYSERPLFMSLSLVIPRCFSLLERHSSFHARSWTPCFAPACEVKMRSSRNGARVRHGDKAGGSRGLLLTSFPTSFIYVHILARTWNRHDSMKSESCRISFPLCVTRGNRPSWYPAIA